MIETTPGTIKLCDFYQQEVLPRLFSRLDRAFPELSWVPTGHDWVGTIGWSDLHSGGESPRAIRCNCPWGFELPDGTLVSWVAYAAGEASPDKKEMPVEDEEEAVETVAEELAPDPLDIYQLAYSIWEQKGRPANADHECWFEAEQYLYSRLKDRDAAA